MALPSECQADGLRRDLPNRAAPGALAPLAGRFPGRVSPAASFGPEAQRIGPFRPAQQLPARVFTPRLGRNFRATRSARNQNPLRHGYAPEAFAPRGPLAPGPAWRGRAPTASAMA